MDRKKIDKLVFDTIQVVVCSCVLAWGIQLEVADFRVVPTGSMLPTIQLQDRLICDKISYKFSKVKRGDIVVFHPPIEVDQSGEVWVKRVIGLPGEKIEIHDGKVFINGVVLTEPYEMEKPNYITESFTIPKGSYFLLGDNRNDSYDSHYWADLPGQNIIGKMCLRYWPLNHFGTLAK